MHRMSSTPARAWLSASIVLIAGLCLRLQAADPAAPATETPAVDASDYKIVSRDQIRFQVTGEADDPLVQRVTSAGEISVPLLGAVKVAGLSLRESETLLEKKYRELGFFLNPQVILSFESYAPRTVSVLGQVNNPTQVEFSIEREKMGIVTAVTRAGGFTRVAQTDSVKVMRTIDGKETVFNINVSAYLNEAAKAQEFKLMPDDVVFVPERVF